MKVLVTGGSGFIGFHLVRRLLGEDCEVCCVVRDPWKAHMFEDVVYCVGDLADPVFVNRVVFEHMPDVVLHLAAKAIVTTAEYDVVDTYRSNLIGTVNLLEACSKLKSKPLFYLQSTDKLFPWDNAKEDDSPQPIGHYALSKYMQELMAKQYVDKLNILICRSCNVIGEGDTHKRILPNTIRSCLANQPPIIYKETPPSHRQYIYVSDLIDAILLLIKKGETGVYHVGTPWIKTNEEVVTEVLKHFPHLKPQYVERQHTGVEIIQQSLNYQKITVLGWKPKTTFEEAIAKTVEWWKEKWTQRHLQSGLTSPTS